MKKFIRELLAALILRVVKEHRRVSLELLQLELSRYKVRGVRNVRTAVIALLAGVCLLAFFLIALATLVVSAIFYFTEDPRFWLLIVSGTVTVLTGLVLWIGLSEKTWMRLMLKKDLERLARARMR